ncbi:MAG: pyruvate carboxylase subunit B [Deltaproteobacteria bacterium]|nr:pyruvate carboxylase subunit B [Deltaproteobacteria bacterium]
MSGHGQVKLTEINYSKDRPKAENPVKIEDLSLRDGHQSLFATRGRTEDMIPVAELMDEVGFWAVETWGGATFDTMHRFLNEDPWERIRTLKKYMKKTPFSMLLRGQNLVGYRNYADDVAEAFVERAAENGMDIFRTFDALNDYRNFETVVPVIKRTGKHFQGCICYSLTEPRLGGEVYNLRYYLDKAKALEEMGADTVCVKDMAGLMAPYDAYTLIKALKETVSVPVHLHSHFTSGMAQMTHLKAIEAGVDILDTCLAPYAFRTSHPAIEPLVMTLLGTNRDTGFDIELLARIDDLLEEQVMPKYRHLLDQHRMSVIDINVLLHQTPGGMLSNLVNQLKEMDALDKIDEVFKKLPKVRKDLGQVPLVTPTSQIVGTQTVNNVLFDTEENEYKMITDQVKGLCYGLYGKTPSPINPEVRKKALKGYPRGEEPITERPGAVLEPELEKAKAEIGDLAKDMDDLLIYALYPVTGKRFLKWKYGEEEPPPECRAKTLDQCRMEEEMAKKVLSGEMPGAAAEAALPEKSPGARRFSVSVDGERYTVDVEEVGGGPRAAAPAPEAKPAAESPVSGHAVVAPMPGMIVSHEKQAGDSVAEGEPVVVLEAMKMQNALPSPVSGTVKEIRFNPGDNVKKGAVLAVIE